MKFRLKLQNFAHHTIAQTGQTLPVGASPNKKDKAEGVSAFAIAPTTIPTLMYPLAMLASRYTYALFVRRPDFGIAGFNAAALARGFLIDLRCVDII
ncbi:MAG: hypothetical protein WA957_17050 [Alteraurantiacibacter sp.]